MALVSLLASHLARADATDDAKKLRLAGVVESGIGFGLNLAGAGLLAGAFLTPSCDFVIGAPEEGTCSHGGMASDARVSDLFMSGVILSVVGDALWIAGVTQWSIGARRLHKLQRATAAR